jgi:DNA polymerase III epsilon subunit-like protein
MSKSIMLDIETLGTASNSVILSIGAVAFDEGGLYDKFYASVAIDSCIDAGLHINGSTLAWWMRQSDTARQVFSETGLPLATVLQTLATSFDWSDTEVWCNGLSFDIPILDTAYRACKLATPWAYYNTRDYRTVIKSLDKGVLQSLRVEPTVKHNALADAEAQALTLVAIWGHVRRPVDQYVA